MDRQTPVKILPYLKLRLRAVTRNVVKAWATNDNKHVNSDPMVLCVEIVCS